MARTTRNSNTQPDAGAKASSKPKPAGKAVDKEALFFIGLAETLATEHEDVAWGKMMSSPGIKYKDKFFAFYYDKTAVFRFGRDFQPESVGIHEYTLLAPFKTKPPLRDWFRIPATVQDRWEELAMIAYQRMALH